MELSFNGTVILGSGTGLPAGIDNGDPLVGRIRFDAESPAAPLPGGITGLPGYTTYALQNASARLTAGSVVLDSWNGPLYAFVRDNYDAGGSLGLRDGFLIMNIASFGFPIFQVGNTIYTPGTLSGTALPLSDIAAPFAFDLSFPGQPQQMGSGGSLLRISPVPEPGTWALWGLGLAALGAARRRYSTSLA